jgi:hypothetical protein
MRKQTASVRRKLDALVARARRKQARQSRPQAIVAWLRGEGNRALRFLGR